MHKKICEQCGKEFEVIPSLTKQRFCSTICYHKWTSNRNRRRTKEWLKKTCEQCGKEFEVTPSLSEQRFCSRKCLGEWRKVNWKGDGITKTCEQCGKEFEVIPSLTKQRFCSTICYNNWWSKNHNGENNPSWNGGEVLKTCEQCGKEYKVRPYIKNDSRFCSMECKGRWHSDNRCGENSPLWKGGISFEPYCPKFNEAFKESVREKFGRVCFLCSKTEEENGRKLCVHHVSYNKDCLCDGSDCEFVPLCNTCHTKTNFNRDYWEKSIMEKLNGTSTIF